MTEMLLIQIDRCEGSLQRLIGLVERRGFHVERMSVADAGLHREVRIGVRPRDAHRSLDVLARQIDRLIGVRRLAPAAEAMRAEGAAPCTA